MKISIKFDKVCSADIKGPASLPMELLAYANMIIHVGMRYQFDKYYKFILPREQTVKVTGFLCELINLNQLSIQLNQFLQIFDDVVRITVFIHRTKDPNKRYMCDVNLFGKNQKEPICMIHITEKSLLPKNGGVGINDPVTQIDSIMSIMNKK